MMTRFATLVLVSLAFAACDKVKDHVLENPTADYKPCNITSMHFADVVTSDATFYYNKLGNPDSVKFTNVATAYTHVKFRYDSRHRLTDYIRYYNGPNFETWTHYIYTDAGSRPSARRRYSFGALTPAAEPTIYVLSYPTEPIVYDAEGRTGGPYDADGNKILPGVVYDDKINIHRTNKVWMFVDADYSRNNPVTAVSYNAMAFPKQFPNYKEGYFPFLQRSVKNATVNYLCD